MKEKQNILKKIVLKNNIIHKFVAIFIYFFFMYVAKDWLVELVKSTGIENEVTLNIIYEWLIYGLLFIFIVFSLIPDIRDEFKGYSKKEIKRYFFEVGIGLLIAYALMIIGNIFTSFTSSAGTSQNQSSINDIVLSGNGPSLIPVICIIGPIVEELIYRVAIQGSLIKLHVHPIVAIIISGFTFGFIHVIDAGDYGQVWPYLFLGIFLGIIYYKNKSIYSNILIHIFLNSFSTGMQYAIVLLAWISKMLNIPIFL